MMRRTYRLEVDCDHCEGHSSLGCDMRCEKYPPLPITPVNLFTDIFSEDVDDKKLTPEQERVIDEILHELGRPEFPNGVDYDEDEGWKPIARVWMGFKKVMQAMFDSTTAMAWCFFLIALSVFLPLTY